MQSAAKVGLLLVVFIGLLIGGYAMLGKSVFGTPADVYFVDLTDAGGVTAGTQVLMAGVQVGTVSEVKLIGPAKARMKLLLKKGVVLPEGTTLQLPTSLIGFGDNPVTLLPSKSPGGPLSPGSTISRFCMA
jgi:phospholipid/cholesterol/gamma-HCH transport system substrate-binding protein